MLLLGSGTGEADINASVYGCFGESNISSTLPFSTIFPRYITATLLLTCLIILRSWDINKYDKPNSS